MPTDPIDTLRAMAAETGATYFLTVPMGDEDWTPPESTLGPDVENRTRRIFEKWSKS